MTTETTTQAAAWLARHGLTDGTQWETDAGASLTELLADHPQAQRATLYLDPEEERSRHEAEHAADPEAPEFEPTPRTGYLWPDGSGILFVEDYWDLIEDGLTPAGPVYGADLEPLQ